MIHSTVTKRGQTTIPRPIRDALRLEGGEHLMYEVQSDGVLIKKYPGIMASFGILKLTSDKTGNSPEEALQSAREQWGMDAAEEGLMD